MEESREKLYTCALSSPDNDHIFKDPVPISCGHIICKRCLNQTESDEIKCFKCGVTNTFNLNGNCNYDVLKESIELNIETLLNREKEIFKQTLDAFNDTKKEFDEAINTQISILKDEVQIRIESLKSELDALNDKFNEDLIKIKENFYKENKIPAKEFLNINDLLIKFENYSNESGRKSNGLFQIQNKRIELRNLNEKLKKTKLDINFEMSEFKHDIRLIGNIECKYNTLKDYQDFKTDIYGEYDKIQKELNEKNKKLIDLSTQNENLIQDLLESQNQVNSLNINVNQLKEFKNTIANKLKRIYSSQSIINNVILDPHRFSIERASIVEYNLKFLDLIWTDCYHTEREQYIDTFVNFFRQIRKTYLPFIKLNDTIKNLQRVNEAINSDLNTTLNSEYRYL